MGGNLGGNGGSVSAGAGDGGTSAGAGGAGNAGASGSGGSSGGSSGGAGGGATQFSFFVTSLNAMRVVSGSQNGFGGDLRYGMPTGLEGADEICTTIAGQALPGAESKPWRAFLSTSVVHARDRIGSGPWYDRLGRLLAANLTDLLGGMRPNADPAIRDDLPNENGVPNHLDGNPNCAATSSCPYNPDVLTGSNDDGMLYMSANTCNDWTNSQANGSPRVGHAWAVMPDETWLAVHNAQSCAPGVNLVGANQGSGVGRGGGYGAIHCFALKP